MDTEVNLEYQNLESKEETKRCIGSNIRKREKHCFEFIKKHKNYFTRLDWEDEVKFPQEAVKRNIRNLSVRWMR